MKNTLTAILAVFIVFECIAFLGAVTTYQPRSLGYVNFSYDTMTVTDIQNSTAPTVGYPLWCTNCLGGGAAGTVCTSTGTTLWGQFVLSTGTRCQ